MAPHAGARVTAGPRLLPFSFPNGPFQGCPSLTAASSTADPRAPTKSIESFSSFAVEVPSYLTRSLGRSGRLTSRALHPATILPARNSSLMSAESAEDGYVWKSNWGHCHNATSTGTCVAVSTCESHFECSPADGGLLPSSLPREGLAARDPRPKGLAARAKGLAARGRGLAVIGPACGPNVGLDLLSLGPSAGLPLALSAPGLTPGAARGDCGLTGSSAESSSLGDHLRSTKCRNWRQMCTSF
mmetsp:Transcript_140165/g.242610  ORF Transcript_140165/g.242610 Transcript_140165/m.242610 type:complete len:244 (+) Transcript_140165:142-873(+)